MTFVEKLGIIYLYYYGNTGLGKLRELGIDLMHYSKEGSVLSSRNGLNLYRGCTHGCIYCDSRSACYQLEHEFEDVEVRLNAPDLLEQALRRKRKQCMLGTGSMSDPYLHLEHKLEYTRECLDIIEKYGFGLNILTKSNAILRDLDLLIKINAKAKCVVQMTLTTYDEQLCKVLEPNVCTTKERFEVLKIMRDHNIPTVVWIVPILPYINDTAANIEGILAYCIEAKVYGVMCFKMGLTLREGNREYFYAQLDKHFPGLKQQYMKNFGYSYENTSKHNKRLMSIVHERCRQNNIVCNNDELFKFMFHFEGKQRYEQLEFFEDHELNL
ncbi:radical SAM protein [Paenibacillus sp. NPDC057934]|uniref:SPL family radical SAM protein n=1 Tax=Paenibacillus sp. NPDC057934 TaxID=3346282 RepID=UPI0036DDB0D7